MIPVMWGLLQLAISAECKNICYYSEKYPPPTAADFARAAVVFWGALLTPIFVGLVAAFLAFRRKHPPRWPVFEIVIVAVPYLAMASGFLSGVLYKSNFTGNACLFTIMWASLFVGGAVVVSLLNLGACVRQHMWGKFALSAVALCAGMFYLLWLDTFIIYINT